MPFTSIAEFLDPANHHAPTTAERKLIAAVQAGGDCLLNGGTRPTATSDATQIRAELLRLLFLGGTTDCGVHDSGVALFGGYIVGALDLRFATARGQCILIACHFVEEPNLFQAKLPLLNFEDSHIPGLFAQGLEVTGSLFLGNLIATGSVDVTGARIGGQFVLASAKLDGAGDDALNAQGVKTGASLILRASTASGTVDVTGAQIGGQFDCSAATLDGAGGNALNAQGMKTHEDLFLSTLNATGTVTLNGAQIGGQLACDGAIMNGAGGVALNAQDVKTGGSLFLRTLTATGTIHLDGARIGGQMNCEGADLDGRTQFALNAQRLQVTQGFLFRRLKSVKGQVYLDAAHVGDLVDDTASWPTGPDEVYLDGFSYDRIGGPSPLTLATRKDWLERGSHFKGRFHPQPYTQFAKVLREMGHAAEARKVLMERDRVLFAESHKENRAALQAAKMHNRGDVGLAWLRLYRLKIWDWFTHTASGYGHAPHRALFWSMGCIGFGAVWFFLAWQAGVMVPNSDVILTSAEWSNAMALNHDAPTAAWGGMNAATHYETFYSLPYALDVFVPLVSIGQEAAWSASTVGWFGWATRWFTFAFQVAGWAITALGIAAITGFVQKNQPD